MGENKLTVSFVKVILEHRWKVIIATLLAVLALGSGVRHLQFENDYRVFFGEDNPQLKAFDEVENTYTKNDNILLVLSPRSGQVFTAATLQAVQWLTAESWKIPHSVRVDSISNFQHTKAVGDDLFVNDLVENPQQLSVSQLAEIKSVVLAEPAIYQRLINPKASVTGVNISIQLPGQDVNESLVTNDYVRDLQHRFNAKFPDVDIRYSGVIALNNAFAESGQKDATTLTPAMYLVMLLVMALLLKSFGATMVALGVIVLSTLAAMGTAGFMGIKLTAPSAIAPTIILTLAIADSVHILSSMLNLMRKGWDKIDALVESMRTNMLAVFLTSITTIVGFLCLNFSDAPPYHDLGNMTAIGVFYAWFFSVLFIPALVAVSPISAKRAQGFTNISFDRYADFIIKRKNFILLAMGACVVSLGFLATRIQFNDEFVKWFDQRVTFRRDADYMMANLTGLYGFDYSLQAGEAEGLSQVPFMNKVKEFSDWWRSQEEVVYVSTYTDTMKRLNKTLHAGDPSWYKIPDDNELAAQYLLLYEMSLPFGLDLNNQMDIDKSATRLSITIKEMPTAQAKELAARGDQWLDDNGQGVIKQGRATGPMIMFSHISERNVKSMIRGTIWAIVLITLLIGLSLRSVKYGLVSFLANSFPAVMAFGLWYLLYTQVGMAVVRSGFGNFGNYCG